MITIQQYLREQKHSPKTIKSYLYTINLFVANHPQAPGYQYKDILNHFATQVNSGQHPGAKNRILAAIKKYYDYLIETGQRTDHPCRGLYLKGRRRGDIIHQDLFTSQELEQLMEREERYAALKLKNQTILSLLIYQGLTVAEIAAMKTTHIDLDSGTLFVKESRTLTQRHLEIQPRQYRILDRYLHQSRKELLKTDTDTLAIGKLGTPITADDIHYLVSTFKPLYPDRNLTPQSIRQSVIANWLNEKRIPLEQVQLMAGHKWISTTARYRFTPIDQQRELINKWHPMG